MLLRHDSEMGHRMNDIWHFQDEILSPVKGSGSDNGKVTHHSVEQSIAYNCENSTSEEPWHVVSGSGHYAAISYTEDHEHDDVGKEMYAC